MKCFNLTLFFLLYYNYNGDNMKSKKGFSLLELLFVMILLAIMVLIAYPQIINRYNYTKKSSFLTEAKAIINESNKKYSTEHMKGNNVNFIAYNTDVKLDLINNNLKYCVNLEDKGTVKYVKVSDGEYFVEGSGDYINKSNIDIVKRGIFDDFDCDYIFNEKDLIDDEPLESISSDEYFKIFKILAIAFVVALLGSLLFRKNSR